MGNLKFADLFAGLGGFHQALERLGHSCVFASELNSGLADLYEKNFGIRPHGDIREAIGDVPPHDILCAGFPCQPFSKAGEQLGFDCPQWGDLFNYVLEILDTHKPSYLLIENVPNLLRHDGGKTWGKIKARLEELGYKVDKKKLSPFMFGVPQVRERAIIVGSRTGLGHFSWPEPTHQLDQVTIKSVLDEKPKEARPLGPRFIQYLETWQSLIDALPKEEQLPSFPIWAMEFGATYPYLDRTPYEIGYGRMGGFTGALGRSLEGLDYGAVKDALPSYAQDQVSHFPDWKKNFIRQNREFYARNRGVIDPWLPKISDFAPSFQKLEWNWKGGPRDLWQAVIQFRASGIRAKRPTAAPSLVALTTSQVPVIPWERRYMTMRECARLQSMGQLKYLPENQTAAHKALGNAVNVDVIAAVAEALLSSPVSGSDREIDSHEQDLHHGKTDQELVSAA
ncbi:DNA (cytosine-5-)-methyltransferase [Amaricoccus sp.]|uniref:DNA cytosine methyltransferase n=1 Tax=Amaricoccus sp. TaxID=1872485 RepID=UPI002C8FEEE9|nr:DNA (cytosine-5-)-methyltransferase [Amaricoccus sp.]HRW15430.1 DNA (cytosine-5-)-methyltransferase [Amaricoccus sp.]